MVPEKTTCYVLPKPGSYTDLEKREIPTPSPKANEVLVRIHAVSLQYRDYAIATGTYGSGFENLIPCSDMAGEIVALGEDVTGWKLGQRVSANFSLDHLDGDPTEATANSSLGLQQPGVLATYRCFPAHALVPIPLHLSYTEASTLPCAGVTAYNALAGGLNPIKAGETVLIMGTGGVSMFALQFAVASGAVPILMSSSDDKLKIATEQGARHVINYAQTLDWDREVLRITNGTGVDHILEVGGAETLRKSVNCIRMGGSLELVGALSGVQPPPELIPTIILKALQVRGILIGSVAQFRSMIRLIEAHPEDTRPVIDRVFHFDEAVQAYAHLEARNHVGKVVIRVEH
ncbi:alcohol dehydrogenase [Coprinopsis cinerea okayama7|uniref:Alcohol dehydrogenase n=1 Tax=Coprinopsis cinerea (strain Okayama-7 / 130 / ATCC MYA-4618 / FGSC 9003) TaxID=240176 RepID=A8NBI3_COPC7|nr:alcohol dehydrogenase [Coprinopsis cinerea okayama7\|eukprot:XP_001832181.2 alcohol dehydrogenase [Coprinopsis cinerea okayama7\